MSSDRYLRIVVETYTKDINYLVKQNLIEAAAAKQLVPDFRVPSSVANAQAEWGGINGEEPEQTPRGRHQRMMDEADGTVEPRVVSGTGSGLRTTSDAVELGVYGVTSVPMYQQHAHGHAMQYAGTPTSVSQPRPAAAMLAGAAMPQPVAQPVRSAPVSTAASAAGAVQQQQSQQLGARGRASDDDWYGL